MSFPSPFAASISKPGHGNIVVALLPPSIPVLQSVSYQYPLKLIAPDPISVDTLQDGTPSSKLIHTVFILTYGGGIVAGDAVNLNVRLDPTTRLTLLTQGSTKIFKTPRRELESAQHMNIELSEGSAICYLPDPMQPFEHSSFEQTQRYHLPGLNSASLLFCDWVCEGRSARGERWSFHKYTSKNEVWLSPKEGKKKLLLRDNLIMDEDGKFSNGLIERVDGLGVYGTLIIRGPVFANLGKHFMSEFDLLPRIGERKWNSDEDEDENPLSAMEEARVARQKQEVKDGLIWTAANMRGNVLVKFGAREVEGGKRWLNSILNAEGTVRREFGERSMLCLR